MPFVSIALAICVWALDWSEGVRAQGLIDQLGAPAFRTRERASRELLRIGRPALPALNRALTASDAEVRDRAEKVRQQVVEGSIDFDLTRLVSQPSSPPSSDLPGLREFLKITGDSKAARELYVAAFRTARGPMTGARTPSALNTDLDDYCRRLGERLWQTAPAEIDRGATALKPEELAAVSFLAAVTPPERWTNAMATAVNRSWNSLQAADFVAKGPAADIQRRLFLAGFNRHIDNVSMHFQALWLIENQKMKEAIPMLVKAAADRNVPPQGRGFILGTLGLIGNAETAKEIKKIAGIMDCADSIGWATYPRDFGVPPYDTLIRDVAMGVCARLDGYDLDEIGFIPARHKVYGDGDSSPYQYGFVDGDSRIEAHARWRQEEQKRSATSKGR